MAVSKKARTNSGVSPYTGSFGTAEVLHLLKRTTFGPLKADVDYFATKTMSQAVDEILDVDYTPPTGPVNSYDTNDPNIAPGQVWVDDYNSALGNERQRSFKSWWIGLMVNQDRTIREKMVLFWQNHFSTELEVYFWPNFAYKQNQLFRADCLKNFKDMVKDVTLDPAMLVYLNGYLNRKQAPDENYARELQELFTLGKGEDSEYTEGDVIEAARVLTGWRVQTRSGQATPQGSVYFQESWHDEGNKEFSSFYNNFTITGRTGSDGANEVDDLLAMIFNQFEVAKYIVRKLYRWFVYYEIDETTEANVITPLANTFRNSNYDIKTVMAQLLKSEHFFDVANRGALIKSPMDFLIGMMRQYNITDNDKSGNVFPTSSDYKEEYYMYYLIQYFGSIQQQNIADPPSVAGWPAYYQVPLYHEIWINSDTLPNRNKVSDYIATVGYTRNSFRLKIDPTRLADQFANVADPELFIDDLVEYFYTLDVSSDQKGYMKSILLAGQVTNSYWTNDWNAYKAGSPNTAESKLTLLFKYIMNLSEYQLS